MKLALKEMEGHLLAAKTLVEQVHYSCIDKDGAALPIRNILAARCSKIYDALVGAIDESRCLVEKDKSAKAKIRKIKKELKGEQ